VGVHHAERLEDLLTQVLIEGLAGDGLHDVDDQSRLYACGAVGLRRRDTVCIRAGGKGSFK
jgi:hypothetical protein